MKCTHTIPEIDTAAIADGLCPLCLQQENQTLRKTLDLYETSDHLVAKDPFELKKLRSENIRLREALKKIIAECPEQPKLPLTVQIIGIARAALAPQEGKQCDYCGGLGYLKVAGLYDTEPCPKCNKGKAQE